MTDKLWPYDAEWHLRWDAGLEPDPTIEEVSDHYLRWVNHHQFCFIKNEETGQVIFLKSSKRGNDVYADKKSKEYDLVGKALADTSYSTISERRGFRSAVPKYGTVAQTYVVFATFTYDTNLYTPFDAYRRVTHDINVWKASMTKEFGVKYASMCVKEGTKEGYPAPHMILILEKPVNVVFWKGQKGDKWIVEDRTIIDNLHDAWVRASGGSYIVDIQGVVNGNMGDGGSIAYYLSKYVGKSVKPNNRTSVYTLAMQKFWQLRDIIPKTFWDALNVTHDKPLTRLDIVRNELKLINRQITKHERRLSDLFYIPQELRALYRKRDDLTACIPPPDWVFIDGITIYSSDGKVIDYQPILKRLCEHKGTEWLEWEDIICF